MPHSGPNLSPLDVSKVRVSEKDWVHVYEIVNFVNELDFFLYNHKARNNWRRWMYIPKYGFDEQLEVLNLASLLLPQPLTMRKQNIYRPFCRANEISK